MFCEHCGHELTGNEAFCGACGARVEQDDILTADSVEQSPLDTTYVGGGAVVRRGSISRRFVSRFLLVMATIALAIVAVLFLVQMVTRADAIVDSLGKLDTLAAGIGTGVYLLCGAMLALFAVLACMSLVRVALGSNAVEDEANSRGMTFTIAMLALCVVIWVLTLYFRSSEGSDATRVVYIISTAYVETAVPCLALAGVALVSVVMARNLR